MANSIASTKNYTALLDEVYRRAACSTCLNSPRRMARAGRNAREIMVPKIQVSGLGDYTRNVGYKTGSITYEFETKTFNYDRGIKLLADVMDVEEAGVLDCFVAAGSELQRTQVAPEADAFTFSEIAGHEGVTPTEEDFADAEAEDVLASLRAATNAMDEAEVTTGSRILFITPTLKGVLDDFSLANPARSNRVLERFSRIVEVPQTRFYSAIALNSGDGDQFGYSRAEGTYQLTEDTSVVSGKTYYTKSGEQYTPVSSPASGSLSSYYELVGAGAPINFMVVERSAVIKFDKHVASRVFSPDELENLDRIPAEQGGDLYLINGNMTKLEDAGIFAAGSYVTGLSVSHRPGAAANTGNIYTEYIGTPLSEWYDEDIAGFSAGIDADIPAGKNNIIAVGARYSRDMSLVSKRNFNTAQLSISIFF